MMTREELEERGATFLGGDTAITWYKRGDETEQIYDIMHILWWHLCDGHLWPHVQRGDVDPGYFPTWVASGIQSHEFHSADPLHTEPSILASDCCGKHGWIRDGKWVEA